MYYIHVVCDASPIWRGKESVGEIRERAKRITGKKGNGGRREETDERRKIIKDQMLPCDCWLHPPSKQPGS